ncbi:MAG: hypothetical protein LBT43_06490 [Prevotella sp.]|jgi:tetratricopeptide (TPR) repeat protein|nr:hypothetical protein [Prevotella sp.]
MCTDKELVIRTLKEANIFFRRKKYDLVITCCDQVLRLEAANTETKTLKIKALLQIVEYYLQKEEFPSALYFCDKAIRIDKLILHLL